MSDELQSPPPAPPSAPTPTVGDAPSDTGKILAALGYPTAITALLGLLMDPYKDEHFVKFHAVQALGLLAVLIGANAVLGILSLVPVVNIVTGILWVLIYPAWLVLAVIAAIKAWNGEYWHMPVVHDFVKQYIK